ncbi:uncharacterized protein M437DRAFT_53487 [Aureobasidium melanogenum CBS 110374]|uniref:ARS binding protein 2 n=1 Tax=Aureobasidium melanogenum (strain CBS 110374) TaxID=1043003 RepID=A0A074VNI9_AURM1|nr:uncharacterized protein M437DRAFT_53487 [Aureobasidium melanogenum CBS 110374]KEQ60644.1 hypothetical protein M437DRAFT_53487 [Aureobasidium melanogenum CBS 110374]
MPNDSTSASPRHVVTLPARPSAPLTQRALPSRDVSEETIVDAYVAFILYCNPYFPLDIDTSDLRRIFQTPPRSDGKDFSIFTLWGLVQRFDNKDIKTWTQLALELGVEPPSAEKGGSVQKVQQYSVRLKRWMRAMHVDAFFEYLLGKKHSYYLDLPPPHDPHPSRGRDGVPADEDLAIRALDPSFRPKRGRKRNETPEKDPTPQKKPLLTTSFSYEGRVLYAQPQASYTASAIPLSARPSENFANDMWTPPNSTSRRPIPHSAIAARPPQHLQWPVEGPHDTATTPHPMSALEPRGPGLPAYDEPMSAITPGSSRGRSRRKHGPAVSSAWTTANATNARARGRPPGNRSVQDGPYTTFPADPSAERSASQRSTPAPVDDDAPPRRPERGRLSLQVPENTGGPIQPATPSVVANEEFGRASEDLMPMDTEPTISSWPEPQARPTSHTPASRQSQNPEPEVGLAYEALKRVLAADLLRADFSGRSSRLLGPEAMRLSDAILQRFGIPKADSDNKRDDALRIAATSWLGVSRQLGFDSANPCKEKEITVQRFAIRANGLEEQIGPDEHAERVKEKFDVSWSAGFGGVGGKFCVVGLEIEPEEVDPNDAEARAHEMIKEVANMKESEIDYKAKYMALDFTVRLMKGQLNRLQDKVLDALL